MAKVAKATKQYKQLEDRMVSLEKKFDKFIKTQEKTAKALDKTTKKVKKTGEAAKDAGGWVRNLRNKFGKVSEETGKGTTAWAKYGRKLSVVRSRMLIVAFAAGIVAKSIGRLFKAAADQQQAEIRLSTALGRTSNTLKQHASNMQNSTRFGDEAVLGAQAQIASFVKNEAQIISLTEATLDLASAKGMDLATASDLVAKTVGSATNSLSRYGISAIGAAKSSQRVESVVKNINLIFGGQARAQAESFAGALDSVKNAGGDAAEALGEVLAPMVMILLKATKLLFNALERTADDLRAITVGVTTFIFGMRDAGEHTEGAAKKLQTFQDGLQNLTFDELTAGIEGWGLATEESNELTGKSMKTILEYVSTMATVIPLNEETVSSEVAKQDAVRNTTKYTKENAGAVEMLINAEEMRNLALIEVTKRQTFANELFAKTATGQKEGIETLIEWTKNNKEAFDTGVEGSEQYKASLEMLQAQLAGLEVKEDQLLQKRLAGIASTVSAFSSMVSAEKTEIESRMNIELKALKESAKFQRMNSKRRAKAEKEITDKFAGERKSAWENERKAKIAQATLNAFMAITRALTIGPILGPIFATAIGVMAFKQVSAMMAVKAPKFAQGGDFVTQGPQTIMVGDNPGGRERVQVTPLSSPNIEGPQGETSVVVNVSGNVMTQDFVEDELAESIKEAIRRGTDFGIS